MGVPVGIGPGTAGTLEGREGLLTGGFVETKEQTVNRQIPFYTSPYNMVTTPSPQKKKGCLIS